MSHTVPAWTENFLRWSKVQPYIKRPKLGVFGYKGVPIGTQASVLPYINHTGGPHTLCMDRTCTGRCLTFYFGTKCLAQIWTSSGNKVQ